MRGQAQSGVATIQKGQTLRWLLETPTLVHYGIDNWGNPQDVLTREAMFGLNVAELQTARMRVGQSIRFTLRDCVTGEWGTREHVVAVVQAAF